MADKFLGQAANVEKMRNSAIKLFGTTISVSFSDEFSQVEQCARKRPANLGAAENVNSRSAKSLKKMENISENSCSSEKSEASLKPVTTAVKSEDKTPPRPENPAACPRCQSVETKFCYFNNYNVNQPRHFCRNCRRYWTVGGTMRNLPRGADRRKSKHLPEFQLQNASRSADLHVKKEFGHQTLIFGAGLETKNSKCLEEMDGAKSSGFVTPLPVPVNFEWTLPCNGVYKFVGSGFEDYRNKY